MPSPQTHTLPRAFILSLALGSALSLALNARADEKPKKPIQFTPQKQTGDFFKPPTPLPPEEHIKILERITQPKSPKAPSSHTPDFMRTHASAARTQPDTCTSCHTQAECLTCHIGPIKPATTHPAGFIMTHSTQARTQPASCASCHTTQTDCRSCHTRTLAVSTPRAAPPPGVQFHPAGWVQKVPGSPHHATAAQRDLFSCTSCHQENDCVSCHTNVNPHPPSFFARCSSLLRANARTCSTCHADLRRIQLRCN